MGNKVLIVIGIALLILGIVYARSKSPKVEPSLQDTTLTPTNSMMLEEGGYEIEASEVNYFEQASGFYVKPVGDGEFPGVVMIHEWWGLNENIKEMARKLASSGYKVLAVDLYEGKIARNATETRRLSTSLDQEKALENMKVAIDYLLDDGVEGIASLGWCFGGEQSLQLSLNDDYLDATVIYYGNLVTDRDQLAQIDWPILGVFGDQDQSIPVDDVKKFETALNDNEIENEIYIYPGVGHAFANPSGDNYAPDETKDAWEKTLVFLNKHLK